MSRSNVLLSRVYSDVNPHDASWPPEQYATVSPHPDLTARNIQKNSAWSSSAYEISSEHKIPYDTLVPITQREGYYEELKVSDSKVLPDNQKPFLTLERDNHFGFDFQADSYVDVGADPEYMADSLQSDRSELPPVTYAVLEPDIKVAMPQEQKLTEAVPVGNIITRNPRRSAICAVTALAIVAGAIYAAIGTGSSGSSSTTTTPSPLGDMTSPDAMPTNCTAALQATVTMGIQAMGDYIPLTYEEALTVCTSLGITMLDVPGNCIAFLQTCKNKLFEIGSSSTAGQSSSAITEATATTDVFYDASSTMPTKATSTVPVTTTNTPQVTSVASSSSALSSSSSSSLFASSSSTPSTTAIATTEKVTTTAPTTTTEAVPVINFSCPAVAAVTQGQSIAFSQYANAVTVQNVQVTGYILTNLDNGLQLVRGGFLVSPNGQGQYVIPVASASNYVLVATQAGTASFDFQVAALDMDGNVLDSFADYCSVPVNPPTTTSTSTTTTTTTEAPPYINFSCPAVAAVTQGNPVALSQFTSAVTVQNAQVTGYKLSSFGSGLQLYNNGVAVSANGQGQYIISTTNVSGYTLVSSQAGNINFTFQVMYNDNDLNALTSTSSQCSLSFNPTTTVSTATTTSSTASTTTSLTCCEALQAVLAGQGVSTAFKFLQFVWVRVWLSAAIGRGELAVDCV